jgi:hypothetical protein
MPPPIRNVAINLGRLSAFEHPTGQSHAATNPRHVAINPGRLSAFEHPTGQSHAATTPRHVAINPRQVVGL